jgi:hypothetical protein
MSMAKQRLHSAYVMVTLKQMRGKSVSKRMCMNRFHYSGRLGGFPYGALQAVFANMVPLAAAAARVG